MKDNGEINTNDLNKAGEYAKTATDKEIVQHALKGYRLRIREIAGGLFTDDKNRRQLIEHYGKEFFPFLALYMTTEQVSLAESQKQLAEEQKMIAERIEKGSDRATKLTRRITCLTYVLTAVGIITFVAVCVQIAIEKQWI